MSREKPTVLFECVSSEQGGSFCRSFYSDGRYLVLRSWFSWCVAYGQVCRVDTLGAVVQVFEDSVQEAYQAYLTRLVLEP